MEETPFLVDQTAPAFYHEKKSIALMPCYIWLLEQKLCSRKGFFGYIDKSLTKFNFPIAKDKKMC